MDVRWAFTILLGAVGTGQTVAAEKIQVDVYIQTNNWSQPLNEAECLASEIFKRSDVHLIWHTGELPAVAEAGRKLIGIRMAEHARTLSPYAMAAARPYGSSGSLITLYQDRLQRLLSDVPSVSHTLLGYIFAHELAHVMIGNDYHSDSGILKAVWSNADYPELRTRMLRFTDHESKMIRDGLAVKLAAR